MLLYDSQDVVIKKVCSSLLKEPRCIPFDREDNFYVSDSGNNRVAKFGINGNLLLDFKNIGEGKENVDESKEKIADSTEKVGDSKENVGDGKLHGLSGMTAHNGKVYVAAYFSKCIAVFFTNGRFCTSFGSEHFQGPCDVAVSPNNQLLVLDRDLCSVLIFTLHGM